MGKMPANDMPRQPYWVGGVAHEGQYQMYNDSANDGGGGTDFPPANMGNDPLYPNDSNPSATPNPGTSGSGNTGNVNSDPNVQINPAGGGVPGNQPSGGNGGYQDWQIYNELGYNPSYPYGSSGSGVPTEKALGFLGNLLGMGGNLIAPGSSLLLSKLGGIGGRMLGRSLANGPMAKAPDGTSDVGPLEDVKGNDPRGGGGFNPFGGLPPGFTQQDQHVNNQEGNFGAPNFTYQGEQGPQWDGGSIFGGRGNPIVPGSGFLNNESSLPTLAGGHSDLGADIALHSGRFRDAIANAPYLNPNFSMGMPKGMAGGQGIGGGGLPMKQNFSDGGVAQDKEDAEHEAWAAAHMPTPDDIAKLYHLMNDRQAVMATVGKTGTDSTEPSPKDMAEQYDIQMRENEQRRRRAMNEDGGGPDLSDIMQQIAAQGKGNTDMSFHSGGMVPRMGKSYAMGGRVSAVPPPQQVQGMGTDTVPAALTPWKPEDNQGEAVFNFKQLGAIQPRPGMKSKLKPEQRAAIEIALRKAHQPKPTI
jgi:hypothetical protein